MKKTFLAMAILGATVASAADSYLYWMVGSGAPAYTYARVRDLVDDNAYLTIYNSGYSPIGDSLEPYSGTEVSRATVAEASEWGDSLLARLPSADTTKSYIIELFNDDTFVGQSSVLTGSALASYISSGGMSVPTAGAWSPTSFAIPEPSSGLLMLVGCAVLALRRRKQKNA